MTIKAILLLCIICSYGFSVDVSEQGKVIKFTDEILELERNRDVNIQEIKKYYIRGWDWSFQRHLFCPPNPGDNIDSNRMIGYWVKGFAEGIKNGGISDMPGKYIGYFIYDPKNKLENK